MAKKQEFRWRIVVYLALIPCILALICYIFVPPPRLHHSSLGNNLSSLFYYKATNLQDIFVGRIKSAFKIDADKEMRKFYKTLDWERMEAEVPFYSAHYAAWMPFDAVGREKQNYLEFWQNLRPKIAATYKEKLPKKDVAYPVMHFRCSDVPFLKLGFYHLVKRSTVEWMANKIIDRGYDHVTVLNCDKHKKKDASYACQQYLQYYVGILVDKGISVDYQCDSILQDFASMFYSPLLVSINPSSFSFMAGIAKDPNDYVACNMGVEYDGNYFFQTKTDWAIDANAPVLHAHVNDYNDVAEVFPLLDDRVQ